MKKLPGIIIIFLVAVFGGYSWWQYSTEAAATIGSDNPSFQADLKNTLDLQAGVGKATFTRATTATVIDFEGLVKNVKSGEARFEGARRVENMVPSVVSSWNTITNATVTATVSDPDNGTTAYTCTATAINGLCAHSLVSSLGTGNTARNSLWIRRKTGTGSVYMYDGGNVATNLDITSTLSTSWKRITTPVSVPSGSTSYVGIRFATSGDAVDVWHPQSEKVTGQTNQNPSEYVSVGVKTTIPYHGANVDGVKYFATQNGNTVSSNVVIEATGAAIPDATLHGYVAEGSRTNLALQSETLGTTWTASNVTVATDSVVAPSGATTAETLTATADNATLVQAVTGTAASYTFSVYLKRLTGTGAVSISADGTSFSVCTINSSTWTRCADTRTLTAASYNQTIQIATNGDSVYAWGAQAELGAFATSYIPTTSVSVMRNGDLLSYPFSSNAQSSIGSSYAEVKTEWTTIPLSAGIISFDNTQFGPLVAQNGLASTQISERDGTNVLTKSSLSDMNTESRKRASSWSGSTMKLTGDGLVPSSGAFDGTMGSTAIYLSSSNLLFGTIRNVKIWKKALTDTQLTNLTSTNTQVSQSAVKKTTVKQGSRIVKINSSQNAKLTDGLVGLWSFNGLDVTDTSVYDRSGQGNNGYFIGGATSSAKTIGKVGQALFFNGTNQYINNIGALSSYSFIQNTATFSISSWIKLANNTARQVIVSNSIATAEKGFFFVYETIGSGFGTKALRIGIEKGAPGVHAVDAKTNDNIITDTLWHHVVVTGTGNSINFYVDGVQQSTTYITSFSSLSSGDSSRNLTIGVGNAGAPILFFAGKIDEVRIYNRALSQSEVTQLYNLGR